MSPLEAWGKPPGSGLRATWLGHSTVLIEIDGLRALTDPVWGREHHRGDLRVRNASSRFRSRFDRCRTLTSSYLLHVDRL